MTKNTEQMLENKASLSDNILENHQNCEKCEEEYLFHMRDNYHDFSIGLKTILKCLGMAESAGIVPPIDDEWWAEIVNRYG